MLHLVVLDSTQPYSIRLKQTKHKYHHGQFLLTVTQSFSVNLVKVIILGDLFSYIELIIKTVNLSVVILEVFGGWS